MHKVSAQSRAPGRISLEDWEGRLCAVGLYRCEGEEEVGGKVVIVPGWSLSFLPRAVLSFRDSTLPIMSRREILSRC